MNNDQLYEKVVKLAEKAGETRPGFKALLLGVADAHFDRGARNPYKGGGQGLVRLYEAYNAGWLAGMSDRL